VNPSDFSFREDFLAFGGRGRMTYPHRFASWDCVFLRIPFLPPFFFSDAVDFMRVSSFPFFFAGAGVFPGFLAVSLFLIPALRDFQTTPFFQVH